MRLKFVKKFIKLIKITNCVCGRICNGCDVAYTATHTQFVILINFMNFLTNFNLITCTFQYIHK